MTSQSSIHRVVIWNGIALTAGLLVVGVGSAALAGRESRLVPWVVLIAVVLVGLVWLHGRTLKATHEKLLHRDRLYAVLSQCNQSIVQVTERDALFKRVCAVAIEFGKFRMAWIGLVDAAAERVKPVAWAGVDGGFLESAVFSLLDESTRQLPAVVSIWEGRSVICNHVQSDPRMAPLREEALKRGYRSTAAFPLRCAGEVVGCFVFYADEPHFFDAEEVKLLEEVAGTFPSRSSKWRTRRCGGGSRRISVRAFSRPRSGRCRPIRSRAGICG